MSSHAPKTSKPTKPPNQSSSTPPPSSSTRSSTLSSLSTHLAMVELKQRILTFLSKLSDRDTYQIAVEDLEKIIQTPSLEGIPMLLNFLYEASTDPKPVVKKESLRLLAAVCASHGDSTSTHLTKIIAHIVKRLKDANLVVKDACRDTIGSLVAQYLKGENGGDNGGLGSAVALFVKPLFEAIGEQNKSVQFGAAMCMAKMDALQVGKYNGFPDYCSAEFGRSGDGRIPFVRQCGKMIMLSKSGTQSGLLGLMRWMPFKWVIWIQHMLKYCLREMTFHL